MGSIFEELVRRFNEANNKQAGEHWTPRDAVRLMARLVFLPIADAIKSGTYLLYDGACGTGGMLTVAEDTLKQLATEHGKDVSIHLYGQDISASTYAICKADLLLKGEGEAADNIVGGPAHSTLTNDAFPAREFDFMLSNPPYGKSWKTDLEYMGGKTAMRDPRFVIEHDGDPEYSLVTRSSDGQLLFLVNKLSKMKQHTPLGSRIAEVHNGSSLFTGDAGQGESNIRRWIIENDWLEAIVALPLNLFYNTGIATYVWVLTNRKPTQRRGKVQLIDATTWYQPLRKNLGKKNCELSEDDIARICDTFLAFKETGQSKIFDNAAFGYWKVTMERPLRLKSQFTDQTWMKLRFASGDSGLRSDLYKEIGEAIFEDFGSVAGRVKELLKDWSTETEDKPAREITDVQKKRLLKEETWVRDARLVDLAPDLLKELGDSVFDDHNIFRDELDRALKRLGIKLQATDKKKIYDATSWRDDNARPVVRKTCKRGTEADPLHGFFAATINGRSAVVEYEPDPDLRDTEQIPLQEAGGIDAFLRREVLPYAADAWYQPDSVKTGYEISFTRYFYKPQPLRSLDEIRSDILALEQETEGLLGEIIGDSRGS